MKFVILLALSLAVLASAQHASNSHLVCYYDGSSYVREENKRISIITKPIYTSLEANIPLMVYTKRVRDRTD